jgi:hypothetical protein
VVGANESNDANIRLAVAATSACGGASDGVLGCAVESAITLLSGWDWYAGASDSQIGVGQYDFQTVVMHELGHALGLGHSRDANSVMYSSLASGTVRRNLTDEDLANAGSGESALHTGAEAITALDFGRDAHTPVCAGPSCAAGGLERSAVLHDDETFAGLNQNAADVRGLALAINDRLNWFGRLATAPLGSRHDDLALIGGPAVDEVLLGSADSAPHVGRNDGDFRFGAVAANRLAGNGTEMWPRESTSHKTDEETVDTVLLEWMSVPTWKG